MLELRKQALTWAGKENNRLGNTVIDNKVTFFKKKGFCLIICLNVIRLGYVTEMH